VLSRTRRTALGYYRLPRLHSQFQFEAAVKLGNVGAEGKIEADVAPPCGSVAGLIKGGCANSGNNSN
jgi:hypothetical protein